MKYRREKGMPLKDRIEDYMETVDAEFEDPYDAVRHYEEGFTEALELCCKWIKENTDEYGALHGAEIQMEKEILEGIFPYNEEE